MNRKKIKLVMIDSLVGNEYSNCLISHLDNNSLDKYLIVTKNRSFLNKCNFKVLHWLPSKDKAKSKLLKLVDYFIYFVKSFFLVFRKKNIIVHIQFYRNRYEAFFIWLLKISGVKLVYTAHNVLPHDEQKVDNLLKKIIYRHVHAIIVHSNFIKNRLLENFHIASEKIHVIPHGNFDNYLPSENYSKAEARNDFNFSNKDIVLLFFGFIREYKGLGDLLEAFDAAAEINEKIKLLVAGLPQNKKLHENYLKQIEKMKFKDNVFCNFNFVDSSNIPKYFHASDLVIMPYRSIDHSGIIHLAFSFSKPAIVTDVGDFKEMVKKDYGFVVKSERPDELKECILEATKDLEKLRTMGLKAYEYNKREFSWEKISKETLSVYKTVLKN